MVDANDDPPAMPLSKFLARHQVTSRKFYMCALTVNVKALSISKYHYIHLMIIYVSQNDRLASQQCK